jgi:hypothetical protein
MSDRSSQKPNSKKKAVLTIKEKRTAKKAKNTDTPFIPPKGK